jgi:hypothetical protein
VDTLTHKQQVTGISYTTLSEMVRQAKVISAIVNTRINQVASFTRPPRNKYSLGFEFVRKDGKTITPADKGATDKLTNFMLCCGEGDASRKRDYFDNFIRKIARDRLTYDQINFERIFTRGGQLHEFVSVDAATIRIALRKFLDDKDPRKDTTDLQIVNDRGRGFARVNVPLSEKAYVQVLNNQIVTEYTEEEMAFLVNWPRTDVKVAGYGYSEVEMLVETITAMLFASEYNRRFFSSGSSPKGVLNVKGNMSQIQLDSFKRSWLAQLSGITGAWRTPIVAAEGGLEFINMQQTNREMEFSKYQDFLIKIACAVYQIAPEEINFSSQSSTNGQGAVFESKSELRLKASRDKGLVPLLMFLENSINREIVFYLTDKYEFRFVGLDGGTERDKVELDELKLKTFKTINEIREDYELKPIEGGDVVNNQAFLATLANEQQIDMADKTRGFQKEDTELQMKMQKEQMAQQAQDQKAMAKEKPVKKPVEKGLAGDVFDNEYDDQTALENEIQNALKTGDFRKAVDSMRNTPITIELDV